MERLIHVDFKCLAPTVEALLKDISAWAAEGATGVVFEWENMFPYPGCKAAVRRDAYTPRDIKTIIKHCRARGLKAIPLVQTFGHVEWFLAHSQYAALREFPEDYSQIRACDEKALAVVKAWIAALLEAHADSPWIHLGADETYRLADIDRPDCSAKREGAAAVFLRHMQPLFDQVLAAGKRPIIWADMPLSHPEQIAGFSRDVIFCDWLYSQTAEYAEKVHGWGLGVVSAENYAAVPENRRKLFEKYWRLDAPAFPKTFYQFPYLPFLREQGFDVIGAPAILCCGNPLAGTNLPHARANQRGWIRAAHRFNGLGVLDTCWMVRGALRETSRTGHRAFLIQARHPDAIPADELVAAACWGKIAGPAAPATARAVDELRAPENDLTQTKPLKFDKTARTHRLKPYDQRLAECMQGFAKLDDDAPEIGHQFAALERAAQAEQCLAPLVKKSDEALAWLLGARETTLRANLWLAVRSQARGGRPQELKTLANGFNRQAQAVAEFMQGRYLPAEVQTVGADRYAGVMRLIGKLSAT